MLPAVATGETDPAAIAALGSPRLHATPEQLCDALGASTEVHPLYRRLIAMTLHGTGPPGVTQTATRCGTRGAPARPSGVGAATRGGAGSRCRLGAANHGGSRPDGDDVCDGQAPGVVGGLPVQGTKRVPASTAATAPRSGNRQMRRLLNQAAHAAVNTKGSTFELLYRRFVGRLGHAQAIGAIAHRLCRLVWKILHDGVTYEEARPGNQPSAGTASSRQDAARTPEPRLPRRTHPGTVRERTVTVP